MRDQSSIVCGFFLLLALIFPIKSHALCYRDFDVPRSTAIANLIIWSQKPALYLYRYFWHSDITHKQLTIGDTTYNYLIRPGEKEGVIVMVHGVLARKEFFLRLISDLVKQKRDLPTIIVPDLLGHGSQDYPADHVFSLRAFVNHLALFIQQVKQDYDGQKLVVLGHSLGGGFSLLLKPLAGIDLDGLILFAPVGLPNTDQRDFKWQIEQANGLPFNFGSSAITAQHDVCFEPLDSRSATKLWLAGFVYEVLASPYESWVKEKLFRDLETSRKQLMTHMSAEQIFVINIQKPLHLFWMRSDQLFSRYRYSNLTAPFVNDTRVHLYEEEGSHLWVYEHSEKAAAKTGRILDKLFKPEKAF